MEVMDVWAQEMIQKTFRDILELQVTVGQQPPLLGYK